MPVRRVIGFDADDTLWHNEIHYRRAAEAFEQLLLVHAEPQEIERVLGATEIKNIRWYGYGFKSYTLSMIEAAIEITEGRLPASVIGQILEIGRGMLDSQVQLLAHAREVVHELARQYSLMLITKGDLLEQGNKIERSGLADLFAYVEIVRDKTPESYRAMLQRLDIAVEHFVMVGNSMKSDILPVLEIGGTAVFIPYEHTWAHEHADGGGRNYLQIEHLGQLPELIAGLS